MSLPPINPPSRFLLPMTIRNNQYKFKTSCNIKTLSPSIPFYGSDRPLMNHTSKRSYEVMSSLPPPSMRKSKFTASRLSPPFPIAKHSQGYKKSTYLQQKYVNSLEKYSEFSMSFNDPMRDYFEETVNYLKKEREALEVGNNTGRYETEANDFTKDETGKNGKGNTYSGIYDSGKNILKVGGIELVEKRAAMPGVVIQESKNEQRTPSYANFVMPLPISKQRRISKQILNINFQNALEKGKHSQKFTNQSLQTDVNTFEFDEWEFDYNA